MTDNYGKRIRLVALDLDGTLLDSRKKEPADFKDWVRSHKDIRTVIASGRQYSTLKDQFSDIKDDLVFIAENGGLVFYHDENIYSNFMRKETVVRYIRANKETHHGALILCGRKSAWMLHGDDVTEANGRMYYHELGFLSDLEECPELDNIVKLAFFFEAKDSASHLEELKLGETDLQYVLSGPEWIDVFNEDINKGTGIKIIQEKFGISYEESMAFGDYMNDYQMIQSVGESYAMENACDELKKAAAHVTASNDDDGVMKILRQL
ncbi:MAG: HAD family hydrolase [Lachnospiraceae bacterium]|jgi:Cof subfamily protein (haloacid dehalogenase superfamily)|nr:HAD family hydrolase [Lachnospiraceae bacterium]MEE3460512.1 HAD family hydrolase [Lachnospiraceae bacterium]